MRATPILFLFLSAFFGAPECYAQRVGKEGNRAVGVVFRLDGTSFREDEATVEIFRRETVMDHANADGVFCVVIPKDVSEFQLVYRAPNYFPYLSPAPMKSNIDPIKVQKVLLRKKDPNDKAQLEMIGSLLEMELVVYRGTTSPSLRRSMREELMKLSDSIEIPPPVDSFPSISERERRMRINARISIDTVVAKMK